MSNIASRSVEDYETLKAYGFSPAKAVEIELDIRRGDNYAKMWLRLARRARVAKS